MPIGSLRKGANMSSRENLQHILNQLADRQVEELEKIAISMLETSSPALPRAKRSFEDAQSYAFTHFDECLRNLAK
jgi:hypothetical protein